jgi:hypothetical protein
MKPIEQLSDDEFARLAQLAACLPDAPEELVQRAIGLWRAVPAVPATSAPGLTSQALRTLQSGLRVVAAVLTFDSASRPAPAFGMRAVGGDTRHLLFSARGRDIDLRISPASGRFDLSGQILGPDESGTIELATQAHRLTEDALPMLARRVNLDELGEFRLEGVDGGTVWLTIRMGGDEIVLPPIDVGPGQA